MASAPPALLHRLCGQHLLFRAMVAWWHSNCTLEEYEDRQKQPQLALLPFLGSGLI